MKIYYELLMKKAMLDVIKHTLYQFKTGRFKLSNCFYISFYHKFTSNIPYKQSDTLKETTIFLESHDSIVDISKDLIVVKANVNNSLSKVIIPFCSITHFVDPSCNFSIHLNKESLFKNVSSQMNGSSTETNLISGFLHKDYKVIDFNSYKNKKKFYF